MSADLTLRRPDDFHVHLRDGAMLDDVAPETAKVFGRALVMPNLMPAVLSSDDALAYKERILKATQGTGFEPLMTIKVVDSTTPARIRKAKFMGVIAGKVYPVGVTTNSQDGVSDFSKLDPTFAAMEACGMVACLHGETPGIFCMDRESAFVSTTLTRLEEKFPRLKIVLEHISTSHAVDHVLHAGPNVAATITVHHLLLTLDDVVGDSGIRPHNFCKPIAKTYVDRAALVRAALSGNPKFFLGTDSAPHKKFVKECASGCAGVYSAPVAMPLLAGLFEQHNSLERLEAFTSEFGARFYELPLNEGKITLRRERWTVPNEYRGFVTPLWEGGYISWKVNDGA